MAKRVIKKPTQQQESHRLMTFYRDEIRQQDDRSCVGVRRQIMLLLKTVPISEVELALANYKAYDCNPHYRKSIRGFFTADTIRLWQQPHPTVASKPAVFETLDRLAQADVQPPTGPVFTELEDEDDIVNRRV